MGATTRGLFGVLGRLGSPPADSDADLLGRYVRTADGDAFAGLVRRHGPMVLAVCRRRLGRDADAEDAFQAAFLALATSAAAVRGEALAGWLYRVAYLIALKAAGRRARRADAPLPDEVPMAAPPSPAVEADEVRAAVDAEVAGLPDRLRAVVVLCLLEGRTNAEAAAVLGTPEGTIHSRLHAARKTLQARLTRRGVAVGLGLTLDQLLGGPVGAAGPRLLTLMADTIPAVLAEAARPGAGALSTAITDLARGVTTMTTNARALTVLGLAVGLLGTAGAGVFLAAAPDAAPPAPAQSLAAAAQKADPPAAPVQPAKTAKTAKTAKLESNPKSTKGTAAALDELFEGVGGRDLATTPFQEILDLVGKQTDLIVRVDVAAFRRLEGYDPGDGGFDSKNLIEAIFQATATGVQGGDRLPIRDVLADYLAQVRLPIPCTFQVRGNQLVIVPAYMPPHRPGVNPLDPGEDDVSSLETRVEHEQIYGGVVAVTADRKPLTDILADLRRQTGANIVLDPRCTAVTGEKAPLTVSLSDVRLYDALRVVADMAELKLVYAGNIYYITTPANARTFQPAPPRPAIAAPTQPPGTMPARPAGAVPTRPAGGVGAP